MGKESLENKENRIDYKRSISGKGVERLVIISKEVKVSIQPIQSNKIRMWLQGEAGSEVTLKSKKRENESIITFQETKVVGKVELKIAIPTTIPSLSIGTGSADVKIKNVLPDSARRLSTSPSIPSSARAVPSARGSALFPPYPAS